MEYDGAERRDGFSHVAFGLGWSSAWETRDETKRRVAGATFLGMEKGFMKAHAMQGKTADASHMTIGREEMIRKCTCQAVCVYDVLRTSTMRGQRK